VENAFGKCEGRGAVKPQKTTKKYVVECYLINNALEAFNNLNFREKIIFDAIAETAYKPRRESL